MKKKSVVCMIAMGIWLCGYADPIQVSITGTANSSALGYVSGQSYTFSWWISDTYSANPGDTYNSDLNEWYAGDVSSDAPVFSDVTGDGLSGTYVFEDMQSEVMSAYSGGIVGQPEFNVSAASEELTADIGLRTPDDSIVASIEAKITVNPLSFSGFYTDPQSYIPSIVPNIDAPADYIRINTESLYFTVTQVAVPEPASVLMIGLGAGILGVIRRFGSRV